VCAYYVVARRCFSDRRRDATLCLCQSTRRRIKCKKRRRAIGTHTTQGVCAKPSNFSNFFTKISNVYFDFVRSDGAIFDFLTIPFHLLCALAATYAAFRRVYDRFNDDQLGSLTGMCRALHLNSVWDTCGPRKVANTLLIKPCVMNCFPFSIRPTAHPPLCSD